MTKSGVQLKFTFKAFRQNRLSFHVKVKDPLLDPVARMLFMREPKVAKGEPPQQPICVLNIVLPEVTSKIEIQKKLTGNDNIIEHLNVHAYTHPPTHTHKHPHTLFPNNFSMFRKYVNVIFLFFFFFS